MSNGKKIRAWIIKIVIKIQQREYMHLGGRSGIIWILIFMIPAIFASMIHDSYKNFLPDSLFTKTIDHLLT